MPDVVQEQAIGGWIKQAGSGVREAHCRLDEIADPLNSEYLAYFEDYRTRYFYDRLIEGQGVEVILECLSKHSGHPEHWMDLGAGVISLFWSIGVDADRLKTVHACDLVPEALQVLKTFKESDEVPQCYRDALALLNKPDTVLSDVRNAGWSYHVFDCLRTWSDHFGDLRHDLVTAIGCFGLSCGPAQYRQAFASAAHCLSPGGRFIGVDWVRSARFIAEEGHDNTYLDVDMIRGCGEAERLQLHSIEQVHIVGDPYYDRLIVWSFENDD